MFNLVIYKKFIQMQMYRVKEKEIEKEKMMKSEK